MTEGLVTGYIPLANGYERTLGIAAQTAMNFCDKLIVMDGSNDGSIKILRQYDPLVISETSPKDFARWHNEALAAAETPWLLRFDADEWLHSTMTPKDFRHLLSTTRDHAFVFLRFNQPFAPDWPDPQTRVVRKGSGYFKRSLHEFFHLKAHDGMIVPLNHFLIVHMLKPRPLLEARNRLWAAINPEVQAGHMSRLVIQQRIKDEYDYTADQ
jgi:hypothetical protein